VAVRVKTVWFKQAEAPRGAANVASVLASTIWRVSDRAVDGLSKAGYEIVTPERGLRIVAEMIAFLLHMADRMVYGRVPEAERAALVQGTGARLAEIMEENIHAIAGADGFDHRADLIAFVNRRGAEYSAFECDPARPSFQVLRFLASAVRELMLEHDAHWVGDEIMEIQAPEALATLAKAVDGFYPPARGPAR
jgi:hypothetical protein